jgi:hypothetical protein
MNSATLKLSPANSNNNPGLLSTATVNPDGSVTYRNVQDREHKRGGRVTAGEVRVGHHAHVEPGKRVVIWGVDRNRVSSRFVGPVRYGQKRTSGMVAYRHEFALGAVAALGGMNLTYVGVIVAIGEKTITLRDESGRNVRLSVYLFSRLNHHFDLAKVEARNAAWLD